MSVVKQITGYLNAVLRNELTAVNQYFLHSRMYKFQGLTKLADFEYEESIHEMKHADMLIQRILFLEGLPNLQDLGKLMIGETVREMIQCDLKLEEESAKLVREAIHFCEENKDFVSSELFTLILQDGEKHIEELRIQLSLFDSLGEQNYKLSKVA
jgi:bacterioferritin